MIKTWQKRINQQTTSISEVHKSMQAEIDELRAENTKLRAAAIDVIDRWDTPLWKDVPATAEYIGRLRAARGECSWVCASCCSTFPAGMPDACEHGDQGCTDIIKRDKANALLPDNAEVSGPSTRPPC